MTTSLVAPPKREFQSFHDFPIVTDLDTLKADIAILGIPYGDPYSIAEVSNDQSNAPTHIRRYCERALRGLDRYDFDIGGTMLDGRDIKVVDCGDVIADARDIPGNHDRSEQAVRKILRAGAMPIILGGDHAIPIPIFRAFEGRGPITLIQIDAHVDWRDRFHGVDHGLSSVIRRASELEHIDRIWQIGLRAAGSGRPDEVQAALDYGSHLVPDIELQEVGMQAILDRIPDGGNYYLTIDADGVDPTIMPAVAGPAPGGVTYAQMRTLINGLARKGRVVGMDIVEITPRKDVNGITAITAGRFVCMMIGAAVRAGYFD
ncbi:agmatinase [Paracoccus sp. pheM1]|uniref:agmatinase n=1 Tax=Paracoccus sp. pheM1 TaxID=2831675 RepID=UPI001BDB8CA3|nr:agmatinase [Paracoccus sp. pheM1]MBT0781453.1 agmatinase [Paracoccus sp. pheM1]